MSIYNQINNEEFISFTLEYIKNKNKIGNPIEYLEKNRKDWIAQPIKIDFLKDKFMDIEHPFLKDVYLKFLIHEHLQQNPDNKELKRWIVFLVPK